MLCYNYSVSLCAGKGPFFGADFIEKEKLPVPERVRGRALRFSEAKKRHDYPLKTAGFWCENQGMEHGTNTLCRIDSGWSIYAIFAVLFLRGGSP